MKPTEFMVAVAAQHATNHDHHGDQGGILLAVVLTEETGEVARAVLDDLKDGPNYDTGRNVVRECIDMPAGARVLTVQVQHGLLCLWAIVNPASPIVTRHFRVVGTGHEHNDALAALDYIGTAQMAGGDLVWHVFEATASKEDTDA